MENKSFKERYWRMKEYEFGLLALNFMFTFLIMSLLISQDTQPIEMFLICIGTTTLSVILYFTYKAILYLIIILIRGLIKIMREGAK